MRSTASRCRVLVALALLTPCALALATHLARSASTAQPVLLWEVTAAAAGSGRLYLLAGTHVGDSPIESFDPVIEGAFARSEALVLEADAREVAEPSFQAFLEAAGHWHDGTTLEAMLSPGLFERLQTALNGRRLRLEPFLQMKPWLVALMLSGDALARSGYQPVHGMAGYFVRKAGQRRLIELEGARPQLLALDDLAPELQEAMLEDALDQVDRVDVRVRDIFDCWDRGDARCLSTLLFEDDVRNSRRHRLHERVYFARNRTMAKRLEGPLRSGQTWFVVVGAGHVVGRQGIPSLLSELGYEVRQLSATRPDRPLRRLAEP